MTEKGTADFLSWMNGLNQSIHDQEVHTGLLNSVGSDEVRIKKDRERRERLGTLRARPKRRRKSGVVRSVFGYTQLND